MAGIKLGTLPITDTLHRKGSFKLFTAPLSPVSMRGGGAVLSLSSLLPLDVLSEKENYKMRFKKQPEDLSPSNLELH